MSALGYPHTLQDSPPSGGLEWFHGDSNLLSKVKFTLCNHEQHVMGAQRTQEHSLLTTLHLYYKRYKSGNVPGGPAVSNLPSNARDTNAFSG